MIASNLPITNTDINQKYQLLAKIGSGGMGDVFLGIQRGAVDFSRLVVIKRIHDREIPVQYSEEHAKMFLNEASVVASLNHPHIVKIYDFCMAGPSVCIVMEYVEGETLRFVFSDCEKHNRRIPVGLACRLILDACDTLHYAHNSTSHTGESRKVIHRDIGLHNLMLDSNGYVKVIDFGIAKSSIQTDMTSPGLIKGNPSYMAPDLFNKNQQDHRIDIYALGLCLYELLTQTRAFKFSKTATVGQIIQDISTRDLPLPSQLVPDLPDGIDDVVMKSVEKDREKRYQTVEAFARDLKKVTNDLLMTGEESKRWFAENFADRLKERREFGAKILELAKRSETVTEVGIPSKLPGGLYSVNSVTTPSATNGQIPSQISQQKLSSANLYKLIAAIFLFIMGGAALFYFAVAKDPPPKKEVIVTDNLIVSCNPAGARLSIDGRELGMIGSDQLVFHVEPNKEHEIVLSKKGYRDFTLPFIGPSTGSKRIDATLIKIETDAKERDEQKPSAMVFTEDSSVNPPDHEKIHEKRQVRPTSKKRSPSVDKQETHQPAKLTNKKPKIPIVDEATRKIPLPDD